MNRYLSSRSQLKARLRSGFLRVCLLACFAAQAHAQSSTANVTVDFTQPGMSTSSWSLGATISTYADGGSNLIKGAAQPLWQQYLQDLGPLVWRIPLYYHAGQVGSSAGGIHGGNEGEAYIRAIKAIGGAPMIAIGGTTSDNDIQASDAFDLVHYFNDGDGQHGGPVDAYIVGNEPDNGFGLGNYIAGGNGSSGFHAIVAGLRQATTRQLSIAGPAFTTWASYKYADFQTFFAADNTDVDIVDFHKYGDGQPDANLQRTGQYEDGINWLRNQVTLNFAGRASQIGFQVGEFNYNSYYGSQWRNAFYTSRNLVHTASVIGHVLRAGGRAYQYADNNGPLGLITDGTSRNDQPQGQNIRLPAYWGVSVWSGGAWTRRFGQVMVAASTTLPDVEVFATDNAKKIVLINKSVDTDRHAVLALTGSDSGTYSAWQYVRGMDPGAFMAGPQFQPPLNIVSSIPFAQGGLEVDLPWMSVVVITID
ncbi:hypothetical protein [Dyella tabacisoli]|uniref:Asl1-like glycosyl hydrolase catalytic domain-containing protein n=1 Tax=Dyella tabacisoli TaxID=2282381 RepID=A0A369UP63_9GAMM|nr:hypothetical protein [Dyella tabacisoli]RDD82552.1 hypothetical protein DVJ77_06380 [Dyella tabacisoli]